MTAYGAAISLRNTINYILHSSHFSLVEPSPHILQRAYYQLRPLQDILERLDRTRTSKSRKKVSALDGRIKDLIWEFQNLLESLLYQQILGIPSQSRADQVDEEMKERVREFGGLLESLPSLPQILFQSPRLHHTIPTRRRRRIQAQIVFSPIATGRVLPQIVFQRLPPHHTTTRGRRRRRLMVHKEKGRKFNTPRIMNGVEGERIRFSIDLHCIEDDVDSFIQRLRDMEKEYIYELYNMPEDDDVDQSISSRSGTKSKMIGLSDEFQQLRKELMESRCFNDYIALFPSYDYLPQYLKMPFLYMGVFPPEYNIPLSKIMNMLACEGWFHNINKKESLEDSIFKCLDQLCNYRYLALFNERNIYNSWWEFGNRKFKTCWLHSSWRYVCRGEARKNKFYHVLNKLDEDLEDNVKGQHCLCLENNILFSIKDFCISMRLNCASSARSLLFFGLYHQYPIPLGDNFKLLGKLDALNLRLYTFPTEILTLVLLKYLALTCNGELPTTISKLFNLRVLIIHPHSNIRICRAPSYVPIEIWDMQVLEHIEILGKSLVAPCHYTSLEKLSTLIGVNASISTILELSHKVPCIRKLGVQIELTPYDEHDDLLSCFGCVSTLGSLETLKCSIINPVVKYDHAFPSSLMLPRWLKKLHLSGMGFSWEYMDVIGSLHSLEVLKLRAYAFRGSKWETQLRSFLKLRFLLIEDSDLVQWKPRYGSFPNLVRLSLKHCYKLEEIHWPSHYMLGTIEVVNCNPVALTCAKKLRPDPETSIDVTASFSFDEKPVTIKFERHGYKRWIKRKDGMPCSPIPLSRCIITDNKNAAGFSGVHAVGTSSVHAADVYEKGSFDEEGSFDATESDFDEEDSVDATESDFDEEGSFDATESDNDVEDEDAQDVPEAVDEADQ